MSLHYDSKQNLIYEDCVYVCLTEGAKHPLLQADGREGRPRFFASPDAAKDWMRTFYTEGTKVRIVRIEMTANVYDEVEL